MNKEKKNNMYEIPEEKIKQILFGVTLLREMNLSLIEMYEKESALKKSHKAYLHVREEAEKMCRRNKVLIPQIADAISNPEETGLPKDAVSHSVLRSFIEDSDIQDELAAAQFDSDMCRGCLRYEDCEEYFMQLRASKKETPDAVLKQLLKQAAEDVLQMMNSKEEEEKEAEKDTDNFDLPAGMVMMSTDTLGIMQDDMLQMTESLEQVADLLKKGISGRTVLKEEAQKAANHCAKLSHEVFKRWDNADFIAIA